MVQKSQQDRKISKESSHSKWMPSAWIKLCKFLSSFIQYFLCVSCSSLFFTSLHILHSLECTWKELIIYKRARSLCVLRRRQRRRKIEILWNKNKKLRHMLSAFMDQISSNFLYSQQDCQHGHAIMSQFIK